jgi:hypothetical protein
MAANIPTHAHHADRVYTKSATSSEVRAPGSGARRVGDAKPATSTMRTQVSKATAPVSKLKASPQPPRKGNAHQYGLAVAALEKRASDDRIQMLVMLTSGKAVKAYLPISLPTPQPLERVRVFASTRDGYRIVKSTETGGLSREDSSRLPHDYPDFVWEAYLKQLALERAYGPEVLQALLEVVNEARRQMSPTEVLNLIRTTASGTAPLAEGLSASLARLRSGANRVSDWLQSVMARGGGGLRSLTLNVTDNEGEVATLAATDSDVMWLLTGGTLQREPQDLDTQLWGEAPTRAQVAEADLQVASRAVGMRNDVSASSVRRAQAAKWLGISPQAVSERLEAQKLVGFKLGNSWRLPSWQFASDGVEDVLPGAIEALAAYRGGVVAYCVWATTANVDLDGMTPAEALRSGRVQEVIRAAHGSVN